MRISNPYGVLLPSERKQGLIGVALNTLFKGETLKVYGNPENIRDYIHLEDMCKAVEYSFAGKNNFDIFNIGSGKGLSVNNVLNYMEKYTNLNFKKEYINNEIAGSLIDWNILDVSKAKNELNWIPKIDFNNGLEELCRETIKIYDKYK